MKTPAIIALDLMIEDARTDLMATRTAGAAIGAGLRMKILQQARDQVRLAEAIAPACQANS